MRLRPDIPTHCFATGAWVVTRGQIEMSAVVIIFFYYLSSLSKTMRIKRQNSATARPRTLAEPTHEFAISPFNPFSVFIAFFSLLISMFTLTASTPAFSYILTPTTTHTGGNTYMYKPACPSQQTYMYACKDPYEINLSDYV